MEKRKRKKDEPEGGASADEGMVCVDVIDEIDREIGFLKEVLQLIRAASLHYEARGDIPLANITADMLQRLERLRKHSERLFNHCGTKDSSTDVRVT